MHACMVPSDVICYLEVALYVWYLYCVLGFDAADLLLDFNMIIHQLEIDSHHIRLLLWMYTLLFQEIHQIVMTLHSQ